MIAFEAMEVVTISRAAWDADQKAAKHALAIHFMSRHPEIRDAYWIVTRLRFHAGGDAPAPGNNDELHADAFYMAVKAEAGIDTHPLTQG